MSKLFSITETWFTEISIVMLDNYTLFRLDRKGHGGGVAIYIHNDLNGSEITDVHLSKKIPTKDSEQLWIKVNTGKEQILLACIYRPPMSDATKKAQMDKEIY